MLLAITVAAMGLWSGDGAPQSRSLLTQTEASSVMPTSAWRRMAGVTTIALVAANDGDHECPSRGFNCGEDVDSTWKDYTQQAEQRQQNRADLERHDNKAWEPAYKDVDSHLQQDVRSKRMGAAGSEKLKARWKKQWKCEQTSKKCEDCPGCLKDGQEECSECKQRRDQIRQEYANFKDKQGEWMKKVKGEGGSNDDDGDGLTPYVKYKWNYCDTDGGDNSDR